MQPQAAVAAEHRDRFGQVVERLALHADQRVVAPRQIEPLGDVVEQIGHAALRIGRGDDAQRAAVRQVPEVLLRLGRAIGFVQRGLPGPEVLLLRQLARRAQLVEHGRIGRRLVEEAGVEVPQRAIGGVVEGEPLIGAEDGDAGRQLIERAAMRVDQALELGAHGLDFGRVDADAGAALARRHVEHVEDAAGAGDDRRHAGRVRSCRRRARCLPRRARRGRAARCRARSHRRWSFASTARA